MLTYLKSNEKNQFMEIINAHVDNIKNKNL